MLDIGGGFPARYGEPVPSIEQIGGVVTRALDELLPYRPRAASPPSPDVIWSPRPP